MTNQPITGGCQCGAVRYRIKSLGRPSICHCRMCQKALGSFFAPLVTAIDLQWTRGKPKIFASSNKASRGFCGHCGTPLTYDYGGDLEVTIGSLDHPEIAAPLIQVNPAEKLGFVDQLHTLPVRDNEQSPAVVEFLSGIESHQHPDHDTDTWQPFGAEKGEE